MSRSAVRYSVTSTISLLLPAKFMSRPVCWHISPVTLFITVTALSPPCEIIRQIPSPSGLMATQLKVVLCWYFCSEYIFVLIRSLQPGTVSGVPN